MIILLLASLLIASVLGLKWGFESPPVKATWVWDKTSITTGQAKLLAFAKEQSVNVIFLHIDRKSRDFEPYRAFVEKAHDAGIEVEALGGDPTWGLTGYQEEIQSFIGWIEDYQNAADKRAAFDGIHVDIEPYLLKEWEQDREGIVRQWMDNMNDLVETAKRATALRVSADLPFWIHEVAVPGSEMNAGAWMLDRFDRVVLMDYRNFAIGNNGIVANALPMVKEGTRRGKPVIIGLETAPTNEGEHTTFYGEGTSSLHRQMRLSHLILRWHAGYQGFSIHDYKSWKEALES